MIIIFEITVWWRVRRIRFIYLYQLSTYSDIVESHNPISTNDLSNMLLGAKLIIYHSLIIHISCNESHLHIPSPIRIVVSYSVQSRMTSIRYNYGGGNEQKAKLKSASWGAIPFNENLFSYLIRNMLLFYLKDIHSHLSWLIFTCWCIINKKIRIARDNCCCHWKKFTGTNGLIVTAIDALDQYSCGGSFPMGVAGVAGPEGVGSIDLPYWPGYYTLTRSADTKFVDASVFFVNFFFTKTSISSKWIHRKGWCFILQMESVFLSFSIILFISTLSFSICFCIPTATGFINITITIKCSGEIQMNPYYIRESKKFQSVVSVLPKWCAHIYGVFRRWVYILCVSIRLRRSDPWSFIKPYHNFYEDFVNIFSNS